METNMADHEIPARAARSSKPLPTMLQPKPAVGSSKTTQKEKSSAAAKTKQASTSSASSKAKQVSAPSDQAKAVKQASEPSAPAKTAKQAPASSALAKTAKQTSASSAPAKTATQVSVSSAPAKAKQPSAVPNTRGEGQVSDSIPPKGANSKKKGPAQRNPANSQQALDDEADSDVVMADETGAEDQLPGQKAALKRKSSAGSLSANASVPRDTTSDQSPGVYAPRPKKAKSSSALGKQVGAGALDDTNLAATPASRSPAIPPLDELPADKSSKSKGSAKKKNPVEAATNVVLVKENESLKALLAAAEAELQRVHKANGQVQQQTAFKNQLIPRPPGDRGKNGWNLQAKMGLGNQYDLYANIRRAVRYAVYKSQLNIWRKINQQDERLLIKDQVPYMARFEGNWATREFIKGICQNARRHCRKNGISDPTLPAELLTSHEPDNDEDGANADANGKGNGGDDSDRDFQGNGDNAGEEEENLAPKHASTEVGSSTAKPKPKPKAKSAAPAKYKKSSTKTCPVIEEPVSDGMDGPGGDDEEKADEGRSAEGGEEAEEADEDEVEEKEEDEDEDEDEDEEDVEVNPDEDEEED